MDLSDEEFLALSSFLAKLPQEEYQRRTTMMKDAIGGLKNGAAMALMALTAAISIHVSVKNSEEYTREDLVDLNSALIHRYIDVLDNYHPTIN